MESCKCTQERRFSNIEEDIKEMKEKDKEQDKEISLLKENATENRVYVKQIFEKIEDLTVLFKTATSENGKVLDKNNSTWLKVVLELIKSIGTIAAIIAGIKILM